MIKARVVHFALGLLPWSLRHRIKGIAGASTLQRAIVSYALDGKEFTHLVDAGPARGIRFHIRMPEDKGIWTGTYEFHFAERLAAAVKSGGVAYDIGSWHGFFAGVMAAQGASEVHVFEPLPSNVRRVQTLIALNPSKAIKLHACAVADVDTEMDLVVMPETSMAKLEVSTFQKEQSSGRKVRVTVRAIDTIVANREALPPHLIKIDVEGAEVLVLQGAIKTIRNHHPEIFAEVHSSVLLAECERLLTGEGYTIERVDQGQDGAKDIFQIRAFIAHTR